MTILLGVIACGLLSVVYAIWATRSVLAADQGNARMQEIAGFIREGAQAYLTRQYTTIAIVGVVVFIAAWVLLSGAAAIGFLIGAVLSGAAGFIGMHVSVRANVRTAQAASVSPRLRVSTSRSNPVQSPHAGGRPAPPGRLGLLSHTHAGLGMSRPRATVIDALVALGFGASLISIFARLGGGIFTKAPMSAATSSARWKRVPRGRSRNRRDRHNVGDNVGDCGRHGRTCSRP